MMFHWQMLLPTLAALVLFASDVALALPQQGGAGDQLNNIPHAWHKRTGESSPGF